MPEEDRRWCDRHKGWEPLLYCRKCGEAVKVCHYDLHVSRFCAARHGMSRIKEEIHV